jgi:Ca-activated chloride channel family protein
MLSLLVLVPLLVVAYFWIQRRRKKFAVRYASLSLVKDAMGRRPGWRRHVPPALFLLGLTIMIVALARPTALVKTPFREGTIVLAMDVSGSMTAEDVAPNRMEAAKTAALTMVASQPESVRFAIVSFSSAASIVQQSTKDRESIENAIKQLGPQRGTAIGCGLLAAVYAAVGQPMPLTNQVGGNCGSVGASFSGFGRGRVTPTLTPPPPVLAGSNESVIIVLLSDGQSNTGPDAKEIAGMAANRGIRVYTIGLGTTSGSVIRAGGRSARVLLDEETLKNIAGQTQGQYFNAQTAGDLTTIYESVGKQLVFRTEQTEITAAFTAAAIAALIASGVLSLLWFSRLP